MSEICCIYKGNVYNADIEEDDIEMTSEVYVNGFEPYIDVLGNKHLDFFMKVVNVKEIDLLFSQEVLFKFKGIYFEPFAGKITESVLETNSIYLFTASETIAQDYGFTKKEQFVFAKEVSLDHIDEIKIIRKPILMFKNRDILEEIIEKSNIKERLTELKNNI